MQMFYSAMRHTWFWLRAEVTRLRHCLGLELALRAQDKLKSQRSPAKLKHAHVSINPKKYWASVAWALV